MRFWGCSMWRPGILSSTRFLLLFSGSKPCLKRGLYTKFTLRSAPKPTVAVTDWGYSNMLRRTFCREFSTSEEVEECTVEESEEGKVEESEEGKVEFDDYRIEVDFSFRNAGTPTMGVANIVSYDKERFVMSLISRALFARDSTHGEIVCVIMGIGVILKMGMFPFKVYNDCLPVVQALRGEGNINQRYLNLVGRVHNLMKYTRFQSVDVIHHVPRSYIQPADTLGKYYKARGLKKVFVRDCWDKFLNTLCHYEDFGGEGQKKSYSTSTGDFVGSFKGLTWVPESVAESVAGSVRGSESEDNQIGGDYYGMPFLLQCPEDEKVFRGLDFEHWFIILHPSFGSEGETPEDLLAKYLELITKLFGSLEARKRVYSATFEGLYAFGCVMNQQTVELLECNVSVLVAIPDFYVVPEIKDYGGERVVDGCLVTRSTEDQTKVVEAYKKPSCLPGVTMKRKTDAQITQEREDEEKRKERKEKRR